MGQAGTTTDDTGNPRPDRRQKEIFLDALAESSNVAASARAAGVSGKRLYPILKGRLTAADRAFLFVSLCEPILGHRHGRR